MREAIELAGKGRWHAAPNPMVGAVLVRDGRVVARGWHAAFGREHAEIACLRDARENGVDPAACVLVVTLEPCRHHGKTPPCTEAILEAGIRRVIVGMADVDAAASGGAEDLRAAGVQVEMGVLEEACRDLASDFLIWQTTERPYVILKMAASLDGRIAVRSGGARFSSEASQRKVMELREGVGLAGGAILVGGNTLTQDDPRLTARLPTALRQPLAAVIISRLPGIEAPFQLIRNRPAECVFFSSAAQAASPNAQALRRKGARIYGLDRTVSGRGLHMGQMLVQLRQAERCLYVLCEGGGRLGLSLLEQGLVDEFHLHLAPLVLGDAEACPLFAGRSADSIADAIRLRRERVETADGDTLLFFRPERNT
jgi:diaminohydroxyphosphoribosylaminopyrimidine deaminase/5-amino-6-(5-phosphoribosylamino)uracil reductase